MAELRKGMAFSRPVSHSSHESDPSFGGLGGGSSFGVLPEGEEGWVGEEEDEGPVMTGGQGEH